MAVRIAKNGAKEELKPNLVGLSNMAISFLPKSYTLLNVISAYRENVAAIRFSLLVNVKNESGVEDICRLEILEKPWIVTKWGDKLRILDYTNCTTSGDDSSTNNLNNKDEKNNFIFNPTFDNQDQGISDDSMKNIESQIIEPKRKPVEKQNNDDDSLKLFEQYIQPKKTLPKTTTPTTSTTTTSTSTEPIEEALKTITEYVEHSPKTNIDQETSVNTELAAENSTSHTEQVQTIEEHDTSPLDFNTTTETATAFTNSDNNDSNDTFLFLFTNEETYKLDNSNEQSTQSTEPSLSDDSIFTLDNLFNKELDKLIDEINAELESKTPYNEAFEQPSELPILKENVNVPTENYGNYFPPNIDDIVLVLTDKNCEESVDFDNVDAPSTPSQTVSEEDIVFDKIDDITDAYDAEDKNEQEVILVRNTRSNTEKDFIINVINKGLEQLDHIDSDDFKRVVLKVVHVKKIDTSASPSYLVRVEIANSHCMEESTDIDNCLKSIIKSSTKNCEMEVKKK